MEVSRLMTLGFAMTKWYADCVDPRGRAAIAYWASLSIGPVTFTWHSVALYEPGVPPFECTSIADVPPPERSGDRITWQAPALGCEFAVEAAVPATSLALWHVPPETIDWWCLAPAAHSSIRIDGHAPIIGRGYAERLVTTVAPWRLPFDELRWGRWIADDGTRSASWIDWRGDHPHTWMLVDGAPRAGATVNDAQVLVDGASLELLEPRTIHARSLDDITRSMGPFAKVVPDALRVLRETKWCSRGGWRVGAGAPIAGWSIHEKVIFR